VLLVVGLVAFVWTNYAGRPEDQTPEAAREPGFRESAREAGILFRMAFLPDEQGEKFKINLYDHGCGVAVADFDGDGRDDVYFVNQLGPNALYRNRGDGTFEDVTEKAGVAVGDRICTGAAFADFDNDGHQDLFVTSTRGGNLLFRNRGDGTFQDVTKKAGVAHTDHSQMGIFFDFDNDGWLDLLVLQTAKWTTDTVGGAGRHFLGKASIFQTAGSEKEYNLLYRNNGNGTFTEVSEKAGLRGLGWSADAAVFDYDGDGRLDVLVTNMFGRAQLYHNKGGTFEDVTLGVLGKTPWGGMGARAFDADNDGRLDLYVVDMHSDMWANERTDPATIEEHKRYPHVMGPRGSPSGPDAELEKKFADLLHVRYDEVVFGNAFFRNRGGRFEEATDRANLESWWPWGIATGDFDNDGFEDVFEPAGMGYPFFYWPNYLLMNNGDGTFADRTRVEGIEPAQKYFLAPDIPGKPSARSSRSAAVADFDGDGRLEIVVNNFNDAPFYFKNRFPPRNHVGWRLTGTRSNRDAVGATVTLHLGREVMVRQVQAAGGYLSQSSRLLHFGLGERAKIDSAEIRWPSGQRQAIDHPAINRVHEVTEPRDGKKEG
jgi:hypothetical protein